MEELPLLLAFLVLSGFFSGMEIAFFSLGAEKIQALKKKTDSIKLLKKIAYLEKLKADSNKLLVTILIGNNVVNVAASSMATVLALDISTEFGLTQSTNLVIGLVTGVMTFLILVFGEITPKALAHQYALPFSLFCAPIISFLQVLLYPIVFPISRLTQKFTGDQELRHGLSEEELKAAIELSEKEGQIESEERDLFEKVLEFNDHTVESIMTPRSKIFSLPDNLSVREAIPQISAENFSRIPIYHETLDDIIGVLKVNQLVDEMQKPDFSEKNMANLSLLSPYKVPLTMKIDTLLKEFQAQKNHLAFVYDEHGGLIGLITVEDIIEEVFGEFEDESDEDENHIRQTGKFTFETNAAIELEHIEKFFAEKLSENAPADLPWDPSLDNHTLSYFLLEHLEHFPTVGEQVVKTVENRQFVFTVLAMEDDRIQLVEIDIQILSKG